MLVGEIPSVGWSEVCHGLEAESKVILQTSGDTDRVRTDCLVARDPNQDAQAVSTYLST